MLYNHSSFEYLVLQLVLQSHFYDKVTFLLKYRICFFRSRKMSFTSMGDILTVDRKKLHRSHSYAWFIYTARPINISIYSNLCLQKECRQYVQMWLSYIHCLKLHCLLFQEFICIKNYTFVQMVGR